MIGLFADHHGEDWNVPCARFGNVAMLSSLHAKLQMANGSKQPCYLVDTHSRGGFSGSPVFVYRTSGSDLTKLDERDNFGIPKPTNVLFALLGIHCRQFYEEIEFRKSAEIEIEHSRQPIVEGDKLRMPSSMTIVLPAWQILRLLDREELSVKRKQRFQQYGAQKKPVIEDEHAPAASPPATDANPTHREDFTRLVGAAARKREQED
jgi:hypothetical protein